MWAQIQEPSGRCVIRRSKTLAKEIAGSRRTQCCLEKDLCCVEGNSEKLPESLVIRTLASSSLGFVTYSGLELRSRSRLRSVESAAAEAGATSASTKEPKINSNRRTASIRNTPETLAL
jgi:hypothetical protein